LITKSNEVQSETRRGHASRPYNSAGRHLVRTSSNVTSSDARHPICIQVLSNQGIPISADIAFSTLDNFIV